MSKVTLAEKLRKTTYVINVFQDNEHVSSGTASAINSNGDLITAAHVISGRLPVQEKDLQNLFIEARVEGKPFEPYGVIYCGVKIELEYFKDPITIDLALLKNLQPKNDREYLRIDRSEPKAGYEVLMNGFSDEINLPFSFDKNIDLNHPDMQGIEEYKFRSAMEQWFRLSIVKSGMIGKSHSFDFNDGLLTGYTMYIDNGMHSGASGGPVINIKGELIGIITQRALTSFSTRDNPGLIVPSGSTIAISPYPILDFYKYEHKNDYK
jgi:hypothetical protein